MNLYTPSICLLTNIPAPYRISVFNLLAEWQAGFGVCFLEPTESRRTWTVPMEEMQFNWEFLGNRSGLPRPLRELKSAAGMAQILVRQRPTVVISGGYDSLAAWVCFTWCKVAGRRFVLWLESNIHDDRSPGRVKDRLKMLFVRKADAIAASGKATVDYVKILGAREEQIFAAPISVDNDFFAHAAARVRPDEEKRRSGYPNRLILYSGRLVERKGVFVLLEAFRRIAGELEDTGLLIVGHGTAQGAMEEFCRNRNLERVYFLGPRQYHEMPYFYALACVLVLPTFSDPWGLVVNEAFACGVPAVVTNVAGACDDLIVDGQTGFAVKPGDFRELAEKILRILKDSALRSRMGVNCRELISRYSAKNCAKGLLAAAQGTRNEIRH